MVNNASILTDSQLVRDTKNGNTESYNLLVEKYYGLVYSVVYSRVQHRETSEDISQEVFLRAYLNLAKLDTPECFSAWLCQLARNLAIDSLRKESHYRRLVPLMELEEHGIEVSSPKDSNPADSIYIQEILRPIASDLRELLLLRYMEELNLEEIARRTGIHTTTVSRRLEKALSQIRSTQESELTHSFKTLKPSGQTIARTLGILAALASLSPHAKASLLEQGIQEGAELLTKSSSRRWIHAMDKPFILGTAKWLVAGTCMVLLAFNVYLGYKNLQKSGHPTLPDPLTSAVTVIPAIQTVKITPITETRTPQTENQVLKNKPGTTSILLDEEFPSWKYKDWLEMAIAYAKVHPENTELHLLVNALSTTAGFFQDDPDSTEAMIWFAISGLNTVPKGNGKHLIEPDRLNQLKTRLLSWMDNHPQAINQLSLVINGPPIKFPPMNSQFQLSTSGNNLAESLCPPNPHKNMQIFPGFMLLCDGRRAELTGNYQKMLWRIFEAQRYYQLWKRDKFINDFSDGRILSDTSTNVNVCDEYIANPLIMNLELLETFLHKKELPKDIYQTALIEAKELERTRITYPMVYRQTAAIILKMYTLSAEFNKQHPEYFAAHPLDKKDEVILNNIQGFKMTFNRYIDKLTVEYNKPYTDHPEKKIDANIEQAVPEIIKNTNFPKFFKSRDFYQDLLYLTHLRLIQAYCYLKLNQPDEAKKLIDPYSGKPFIIKTDKIYSPGPDLIDQDGKILVQNSKYEPGDIVISR